MKIEKYLALIEREIARTPFGKEPASLYEPIRYLMAIGGKRLRPMLVVLGYQLFRQDARRIVKYAAAVEAFHNFTLMHDDIMDKAPLRRGHPTVHEKWNTNTAILSGDVMLVRVYEMFADLPDGQLREVLKAFSRCAAEVCEGQQWDMDFETVDTVKEADYIRMIRLKTAVLLGFSLELGAILAGATMENRKALREFGTSVGLGFQLKDDLLDAYADPRKFGKQVGGDIIANKKTYLLIKALELSKGRSGAALRRWLEAKRFRKAEKVAAVKEIFDSLDIPRMAERKVDFYFKKAFRSLEDVAADPGAKDHLKAYTAALIARQS